jgi:threonine synthase
VTPVVAVGGLRILELFHGPTAAFKDVALQFLGNLFEYLLARDGGELNICGATSGDTGSAAIYGVRGKERISIFMLHPKGRVSPIQERQMTSVLDANVHNIAVRGSFDDAQRIVKDLFNDLPFKSEFSLGAVNSINWARILAQMVYYVYAWARFSGGDPERPVSFSVPTGNFGDVFAGYLAKRMGVPIDRLIIATNRNDILTRFVQTGVYAVGEVYQTLSPAMDIQIASNFERYLYFLYDGDAHYVRSLLETLQRTGRLEVDAAHHAQSPSRFRCRCGGGSGDARSDPRDRCRQRLYSVPAHCSRSQGGWLEGRSDLSCNRPSRQIQRVNPSGHRPRCTLAAVTARG